jgi:FkbM family methyltransferase
LQSLPKSKFFPAFINAILVNMQKVEWRGKHKFYLWMSKFFSQKVIVHKIDNRQFCVPIGEWCFWLEYGPENYYLDEFIPFCNVLSELKEPFTLFDLGADIGTVSSLVSSYCDNLKNVIAIEPNPKSFHILEYNLSHLTQSSQSINSAVSDFDGKAWFYADPTRINDHEGYISGSADAKGDTQVISLDIYLQQHKFLPLENNLAIKIDVEGHEIQVLLGAKQLLKDAGKVVILIEVHPDVLARTGQSPDDLFTAAEQARPFTWMVPLQQNLAVDRKRTFFEQFPSGQYDIIGISS